MLAWTDLGLRLVHRVLGPTVMADTAKFLLVDPAGLRPTEYVQALRIALARERLEFSRDTVERIAWNVGYKDPSAFRRVFQKVTGLSASAYRDRFSAAAARA